ncbi:alpha-L-rhamnosidase-related protein [Qaidamihabitans albus]|uniref:alpha-L-rhamnosidase-related protein n=1 Tax=Qaidamihabitans albus TaxID=2795733 RepID=UPI0018F1BAC4|nr:hypothetical protein [Qaidamihabitans albus]
MLTRFDEHVVECSECGLSADVDTVVANWDVASYYRQLVRNMSDAQLDNGMVPDIAPEYTVLSGGFRDDPNWGGAIIMAPWKMFDNYGDIDAMRENYPAMRR